MLLSLTVSAQDNHHPDVVVEDDMGRRVRVSEIVETDKPTVFIFWGAICPTCNMALETLSEEFYTWRDEFDFQIVAVCTADQRGTSKAKAKAKSYNWPFLLLFDKNQDLKRAMNVSSVPHFIVTDASGSIIYTRAGYIPGTEAEIYEKLASIDNLR